MRMGLNRGIEPGRLKHNGKNNTEGNSSILILHVFNCISDKKSTNKYLSKIFLECQIANKLIACVCDYKLTPSGNV
jgi:hypothetical protein